MDNNDQDARARAALKNLAAPVERRVRVSPNLSRWREFKRPTRTFWPGRQALNFIHLGAFSR